VAPSPTDARGRGREKAVAARRGRPFVPHRGDVATSDRLYDADEAEWLRAVERHKAATGDRFPTYADLLGVLKSLGYAKPGPKE
jgi:hypothetical protein